MESAVAVPRLGGLTQTERNWLKAAGLVVGAILLFYGIRALEIAWAGRHRSQRLVYHPVETSMRCLAIPHFLIAILFTLTSRTMQRLRSWIWMAGLAALGVGFCFAFSAAGGREGLIAKALFITYFAVHEFRDEAFFYVANGDAPGSAPRSRGIFVAPIALLWFVLALVAIGAAFRIGGLADYTRPLFGELPSGARMALGLLPMGGLGGWILWLRAKAKRDLPGGTAAFFRTHRPIFRVFGGIFLLVLLDLILHGKILAIVTLHVTAWYVFTMHRLGQRPLAGAARSAWEWVRSTPAGFRFLHLGLVILVTAACAFYAWGHRNAPSQQAFHLLTSREAFPYWTIMHITLSFLPR